MAKTIKVSQQPPMRATAQLRWVERKNEFYNPDGPPFHQPERILQQLWEPVVGSCVVYDEIPKPEWRDVPVEKET